MPVLNGGLLAEGVKQFAVAGEKAGSVGPHCSPFLAQAELYREPVQLHAEHELTVQEGAGYYQPQAIDVYIPVEQV